VLLSVYAPAPAGDAGAPVSDRTYDVLFLCTGNSARSLIAECVLRRVGGKRFRAHSAGSHPQGTPNETVVEELRALGYDTSGLRSKSWDEFGADDAPRLDFVFTVCDAARAETCPVWPGHPVTAHWGAEDPAAFSGTDAERRALIRRVHDEMLRRIEAFTRLPLESLDDRALRQELDGIG